MLAGLAIGYLVVDRLGILDGDLVGTSTDEATGTDSQLSSSDEGSNTEADQEGSNDAGQTGVSSGTSAGTGSDTKTDIETGTETGTVSEDLDWPGGTGPVPDGEPEIRRAEITQTGEMVLTGSAPDWATVTKIVQFAGEKLPAGPDAVDNQLTWHPNADASPQWGDVVMDSAAVFEASGAVIASESIPSLDLAAEMLNANPTVFAVVIGHADTSGDAEVNAQLAVDRADAVVDYLVSQGVVREQIVVASAGSDDPTASNETEDGRAENRRVDIKFKNLLIPGSGIGES